MSPRARKVTVAAAATLFVVPLLWRPQATPLDPVHREAAHPTSSHAAPPAPAPIPRTSPSAGARASSELVMHAVEISRLDGFPPDASAGDVFDVWVAWNPPIVKGPNVQLLLKAVALEKIAPPVTPEGPYVAFLLMSRREAREFLYATRYGALSVTVPAG